MQRFLLLVMAVAAVFAATPPPSSVSSPVGSVHAGAMMLQPRSGHTATLLPDGRVLIAGGMRRNQDFYRSAELYDPASGKFQRTADMNLARVGHAAVLLGSGKVLIAGGWVGGGCTDSAELYDPATGKFTTIANMTARRGNPTATLLPDGDVLIAGGAVRDTPGGIASAEIFRAASLRFEAVEAMHYPRISHTATLLRDGRVLIAGGRGENVTASAELYDPKTRRFVQTGSLLMARYKHTAGLLPDGKVLIAGGSDSRDWNGLMNSAEIYDPANGKFVQAAALNESRFKLANPAVPLASGQLLVAGGASHVEVFNPQTGKFLLAWGELGGAWHFMTETRLKDGSVLLAGGYPDPDRATAQTWIYRP